MKPKGKVKLKWSPEFAYAVGLLASDGNLSKDERHIDFTSKDKEQIINFKKCLSLDTKIGTKKSGRPKFNRYYRTQFGDVLFYRFLEKIGLTKAKSKSIGKMLIPRKYFFDFLRGCYDGDGSFYKYWDKRWKNSYMFYTILASASPSFINWIRKDLQKYLDIRGHISISRGMMQLKYAKKESVKLLKSMYYKNDVICLPRKRLKIQKGLAIIDLQL